MSSTDKYRNLFIEDTRENLDQIFDHINRARSTSDHSFIVQELFRLFHSIKGAAASMALNEMAEFSHKIENMLQKIRDEKRNLTPEEIDRVEEGAGIIEEMLAEYEATGKITLKPKLFSEEEEQPQHLSESTQATPESAEKISGIKVNFSVNPDEPLPAARIYMVIKQLSELEGFKGSVPSADEIKGGWKGKSATLIFESSEYAEKAIKKIRDFHFVEKAEIVREEMPPTVEKKEEIAYLKIPSTDMDTALRILGDILFLEMTLEGLLKDAGPKIKEPFESLQILLKELRTGMLNMNLMPFDTVLPTLQRTVRELSRKLGKKINLQLEGGDLKVDRSLLAQLLDPLMHILRNAMDHGIETSEEREKIGKSPQGNVKIRAFSRAGWTIIEVEDDGRGMNRAKILEKAVQKGIVKPEKAHELTDEEVFLLTTLPGFSSKDEVTEVSGRGVGMDVVADTVKKLGGVVEIESQEGKGTTIRLKLPAGGAIFTAAVFSVGGFKFAIHADRLVEVVEATTSDKVKEITEDKIFLSSGEYARIYSLSNILKINAFTPLAYLIVDTGRELVALSVSGVHGTRQIYFKPFRGLLKHFKPFAGTTIYEGGEIALVIDYLSLSGG